MNIRDGGIDTKTESRYQPWGDAGGWAPDSRYYDFRRNPELTRVSLEDFIPLNHYPSVQKFYDLLEWVNGDNSPFESNDSRLRPVEANPFPQVSKAKFSRDILLGFFLRNLKWNLSPQSEGWCKVYGGRFPDAYDYYPNKWYIRHYKQFYDLLSKRQSVNVDFAEQSGVTVFYQYAPVIETRKFGHQFFWRFWIFGDNEEEIMHNLSFTVQSMADCLTTVAKDIPK